MATKTISITTEAYDILKSWKKGNESFSEAILKMGKKHKLTDYAGIISDKEAKYMRACIKESRAMSRRRMERFDT